MCLRVDEKLTKKFKNRKASFTAYKVYGVEQQYNFDDGTYSSRRLRSEHSYSKGGPVKECGYIISDSTSTDIDSQYDKTIINEIILLHHGIHVFATKEAALTWIHQFDLANFFIVPVEVNPKNIIPLVQ